MRQNQVALAMCILDTTRYPRSRNVAQKTRCPDKVHAKRELLARKLRYPERKAPKRGEAVE